MDELWDKYNRNSKGWLYDPIERVHPRIYLGSREQVDLFVFGCNNITHAINCAEDGWSNKWFKHEFPERYECIGAEDNKEFDIRSVYPKFENIMNRFLADPECQNIFIHCQCGVNRSAFLLLMYVCKKFRYNIETTVKNILLQRPCCFRNESFRKQVIEYIKKLE